MESPTAASRLAQPDLELLRVGTTVFVILFGAMLVLSVPLLVRDLLNNAPYLERSLLMTASLAFIVSGLITMHSKRYAAAYVRRWNERLRMSKAEQIRHAILVVSGVALLILLLLGPSILGALLWPGQTWMDYQIAAEPFVWLVASAGFAGLTLWRWADRSGPAYGSSA